MRRLVAWLLRLRGALGNDHHDRELDDELESHLQMHIEDNLHAGMTAAQARRRALLKFGGVDLTKENYRDRRGIPWAETLFQDIRFAARMLRKNPGFTVIVVLTLGVGIGANTALFSMVDSLLLRPLPVTAPEQIAALSFQQRGGPLRSAFSIPDYLDIRDQTLNTFADTFGYQLGVDGLSVNGNGDQIDSAYVTGNFFSALGIKPALGRFILPSEGEKPGADPVIVISYKYWKSRFNFDPSAVGKAVSVNGKAVTIVGVAPAGFDGPSSLISFQAYLPLAMAAGISRYPDSFMINRGSRSLNVLGRLRPGTNLAEAQASLGIVGQRLSREYPGTETGIVIRAVAESQSRLGADEQGSVPLISELFLSLAALVLLLACIDVANILFARATTRKREIAIRVALGAGRGRLMCQLLTESLLLALAGGVAGILIGESGIVQLSSIGFQNVLHFRLSLGLDWRVFSYASGAALLIGITLGLLQAFRVSYYNLSEVLHGGTSRGRGVGRGLLNAITCIQVAGSLMLLIIAGLFARSLRKVQLTDLGFDPNHVLNLSMDPNEIGYDPAQTAQFYKTLLDEVRTLPGVESASIASSVPMGSVNRPMEPISIDGYKQPSGEPDPVVAVTAVSSNYFKTMAIPLVHGRAFTADDDDQKAQLVAVVNQTMAKQFWPTLDALGRRFNIEGFQGPYEIVGVVKDFRYQSVIGSIQPNFLVPYARTGFSIGTLQARTSGPPERVIPEIDRVIDRLAPGMPVFNVQTMTEALNTLGGLLTFRLGAAVAAALAALGLILAIAGVYGVISFSAASREKEIGIRMALGARPADAMRMILQQGMIIVAIGLVIGLCTSVVAARLVERLLIVSTVDTSTYVLASAALALIALAACYFPARRAISVDPATTLRHE